MSARIMRCAHCGGSVLADACISCTRPVGAERVSLREALSRLAEPDHSPHCGPRQSVPASVSLERVRLWSRGEDAP